MFKKLVGGAIIAATSMVANAGLIQNGSFENLGGQTLSQNGGNWDYFNSIPGWTGVNNIEIHRATGSAPFASTPFGQYYAELNAHPRQVGSFQFFQSFNTVVNESYTLEFYAQKREHGDGSFSVSVGDIVNQVVSSHVVGDWTLFSYDFTAVANTTTLTFTSGQSGSDTIGHYIDNVSVASVPEPGVLSLLAGGLLALGVSRRKFR